MQDNARWSGPQAIGRARIRGESGSSPPPRDALRERGVGRTAGSLVWPCAAIAAAAAAVAAAAAGAVDAEVTRRRDVHRPADGLRFHRTVRKTRRAPRRGRERVRARPAWTPGAGGGCNQPSGLPRLTRGRRFHDRS
eukprot:scaffold928_cov370-Prasinococcus_capsulatus_cf.AAC.9